MAGYRFRKARNLILDSAFLVTVLELHISIHVFRLSSTLTSSDGNGNRLRRALPRGITKIGQMVNFK